MPTDDQIEKLLRRIIMLENKNKLLTEKVESLEKATTELTYNQEYLLDLVKTAIPDPKAIAEHVSAFMRRDVKLMQFLVSGNIKFLDDEQKI